MGANWLPGKNPESIPYMKVIPKIALPTVFGDALSYMEMVTKICTQFNEGIDAINDLANNLNKMVLETVNGAKIPVYGELKNNGSVILSANNWYLDNPKEIFDAMSQGKMCILYGNISYNIDNIPIVQDRNFMYYILTEYYGTNITNSSGSVYAKFISYDSEYVNYVIINFAYNYDDVSAEIVDFSRVSFPTSAELEAVETEFRKSVIVYKGLYSIPKTEGQYVELVDNATEVDLSTYFVVQSGGHMYVPDCCPVICVDYRNGNVGELTYGGNSTPWARIYSKGVCIYGEINDRMDNMSATIGYANDDIAEANGRIDGVEEDITNIYTDLETLQDDMSAFNESFVSYDVQSGIDATRKGNARSNIDAACTQDPEFTGILTLSSGYNSAVYFTVTKSGDKTILYFNPVRVQIDGLLDPTSAQMAATKNYVDNAIENADAVKYSAQQPTDGQMAQARENIGAVGEYSPHFYEAIYIEGTNRTLGISVSTQNSTTVILLGGTAGEKIVRGVADPTSESDAANKRYVDNKFVDAQNAVRYTQQELTTSQKEVARHNIDARSVYDTEHGGTQTIYINDEENDNTAISIDWHSENSTDEKIIDIKVDDSGVHFVDNDEESATIYVTDDNSIRLATSQDIANLTTPLVITINSSENAWTSSSPLPGYSVLSNIINFYVNGGNLLISFPTTGVSGVGYACPKCCSLDYGIMVEAFNGTTSKQYTINADGTVTTVSS